jgi:hypothetical protein
MPKNKATKAHDAVQKNIRKIKKLEAKFGGYRPELITMYFSQKLESLTRVLIVLTMVLIVLTGVYIYLLVRAF